MALVTGGGSGIGRATALALGRAGATVIVADLDGDGCAETALRIEADGGLAFAHVADVSAPGAVVELVAVAEARCGGLDILHNNAGVPTATPRFPDGAMSDWERTLAVNLWAVIAATQAAVPAMRRRGGGVIVNTASDAGLAPYALDPVYAATKHGVVGLSRSLAFLRDEAKIRVNCVCPGLVRTPMVKRGMDVAGIPERIQQARLRMMLAPEEVAAATLAIIADDAMAGEAVIIVQGKPPRRVAPAATLGDR